jgi:hypothetical protein
MLLGLATGVGELVTLLAVHRVFRGTWTHWSFDWSLSYGAVTIVTQVIMQRLSLHRLRRRVARIHEAGHG